MLKGKQMPKAIASAELMGVQTARPCQNFTAKRSSTLRSNAILAKELRKRLLEVQVFKENVQDTTVDSKANLHAGEGLLYLHQRAQLS